MKQLFYEKKFYKDLDDQTAQEIGVALVSSPRPYHIMVDGEALKASMIEVRDASVGTVRMENKVSMDEVRKFERTYTKWKQDVPPEEQSMEFYAAVNDLIVLHGVFLAPSGRKRCRSYTVIDPDRFTKFSRLYAAMQEYHAKVDYAKRKEIEELEAKAFPS